MRDALLLAFLGTCWGSVAAASPPIPSETPWSTARTVFKCDLGGRTLYTDRPCPGARSIEPIVLQGIVSLDDRVRASRRPEAPVNDEVFLDAFPARADAIELRGARSGAATNPECPHLAQRMATVLAEHRSATSPTRALIEQRLAIQRQRYRELGC